jgi:biopolymer transport protein TolQ
LHLVLDAGPVVQSVMAILIFSSLISWMFIIERWFFFLKSNKEHKRFFKQFLSGVDLNVLYKKGVNSRSHHNPEYSGSERIFRSGFAEYLRLRQQPAQNTDPDMVMEGVERAMRVALAYEEEKLDSQLNFLATVGSTAPYVGLFGTVWGIMNSFRGIAEMKQASLAVVAPGISEALIATAIGLFAAIPAVIAYNRYSAKSEILSARYEMFADQFSNILHRQVHTKKKPI